MQVPSNPKVIIGQIHSYTGKSKPLVKLQSFKSRIEALVKISPKAGKDQQLTFPGNDLSSDVAYQIKLQDSSAFDQRQQCYANVDHLGKRCRLGEPDFLFQSWRLPARQ